MLETRQPRWSLPEAARSRRLLVRAPVILALLGGLLLPGVSAGDSKGDTEETRTAAEIKGQIENVYIILYTGNGRPGLQYLTEKKAAVPAPAETKALTISTKEAVSVIDHLAAHGMFAKSNPPLEGAHPPGWYLQVGPTKKGRCVWKLGDADQDIDELPLIRHMLKTLQGDNKGALKDWLKGNKQKPGK